MDGVTDSETQTDMGNDTDGGAEADLNCVTYSGAETDPDGVIDGEAEASKEGVTEGNEEDEADTNSAGDKHRRTFWFGVYIWSRSSIAVSRLAPCLVHFFPRRIHALTFSSGRRATHR